MAPHQKLPDLQTVEYFDAVAADYFSRYRAMTPGGLAFRLRKQRVLELFDKPGGKVLDVGCGPGIMVDDLIAQDCKFWGIDPSLKVIEQCRKNFSSHPNSHFSIGTAEQIEYPDQFFDAVICMGVIERLKNHDAALREMVRVLKQGGTLIVTLPNKFNPYFLWRDFIFYPLISLVRPLYYYLSGIPSRPIIPSHSLYSAGSYAEGVNRNGCRVTDLVYCVFNFFLPPLDLFFPNIAVWAMTKSERFRNSFICSLGSSFIVRARKQ